jgi:hypothetical protein
MKSFSQRKGIVPVAEIIQIDSINDVLRNSIWNSLDLMLWSSRDFMREPYHVQQMDFFSKILWFDYFKKPFDTRPKHTPQILQEIRDYFFACKWNEVYDFLEFVVKNREEQNPGLIESLNRILERELSGYRIVSGVIVDITNQQEIEMLDEAQRDTRFAGVAAHLQRALELLADRQQPDYRNSIKESISAIESMARVVVEKPKATLGDALRILEKQGGLHPALKDGFGKLYGYTSDEQGIRHAMLDEPTITAADAKFFLLSCTSFANYLKAQLP